jgi:hypothetical protein
VTKLVWLDAEEIWGGEGEVPSVTKDDFRPLGQLQIWKEKRGDKVFLS